MCDLDFGQSCVHFGLSPADPRAYVQKWMGTHIETDEDSDIEQVCDLTVI